MNCIDEIARVVSCATELGAWQTGACAEPGGRICGYQTRLEEYYEGDTSALNDVRLTCCHGYS